MNRGRGHEAIFLDSKDYQTFIDRLKAVSEMFKAQIAAYAIQYLSGKSGPSRLDIWVRHLSTIDSTLKST